MHDTMLSSWLCPRQAHFAFALYGLLLLFSPSAGQTIFISDINLEALDRGAWSKFDADIPFIFPGQEATIRLLGVLYGWAEHDANQYNTPGVEIVLGGSGRWHLLVPVCTERYIYDKEGFLDAGWENVRHEVYGFASSYYYGVEYKEPEMGCRWWWFSEGSAGPVGILELPNRLRFREVSTRECSLYSCPAGDVEWLTPAPGVVDARKGLGSQVLEFKSEADMEVSLCCFDVCVVSDESITRGKAEYLELRREREFGILREVGFEPTDISLGIHVQERSSVAIAYRSGDGFPRRRFFVFHPGNVNGSLFTDVRDVDSLIGYLRGEDVDRNAPWGETSADIDRSGTVTPADLIALIDGLNGAGGATPWLNTPKPQGSGECIR